MCNALGIITYNDSSVYVEGMQKYRPIAGFSFLGRYRLVDFAISNMSNSGIDDIQIYVNGNPRSLIDHVGTGRHYNINSKHGHLSLVPVYTDGGTSRFTTDISCYAENIHAVMENHNDYVVIAPANMLYKGNYEELLKQHIESGAEVSVLYQHVDNAKENYIGCDVLQMNKQRGVLSIEQNLGNYKSRYLSLQTYIMSKEIFKTLVEEAQETSSMYWFKDILNDKCVDMDIRGLNYRGHIYAVGVRCKGLYGFTVFINGGSECLCSVACHGNKHIKRVCSILHGSVRDCSQIYYNTVHALLYKRIYGIFELRCGGRIKIGYFDVAYLAYSLIINGLRGVALYHICGNKIAVMDKRNIYRRELFALKLFYKLFIIVNRDFLFVYGDYAVAL